MAEMEDLRNEYREVSFNLRFLTSMRIGLLAFFVTFIGTVATFAWNAYKNDVGNAEVTASLKMVIPAVGLLGVAVFYFVEKRLLRLYDGVLGRALELENIFEIKNGMYRQVLESPSVKVLGIEATLRNITAFVFVVVMLSLLILLVSKIFL